MINAKEVVGDFNRHDKKVQGEIIEVLTSSALEIERTAKRILKVNVIEWTGNLATSIITEAPGKLTRHIGPDPDRGNPRAVYAEWIEEGGRGGFSGYHYMRDSFRRVKPKFISRLKKAVEL